MRRLALALLILAVLAVGADRGGLWLAERAAAERVRAQGLPGAEVDIRGVPFLTQLLRRELGEVAVTAQGYRPGAAAAGGAVPVGLGDVRVLARGVAIRSTTDATARTLRVDGVVPYAEVSAAAGPGTEITPAADGQVQVVRTVEQSGRSVRVRALARLGAADGQLVVRPTEVAVDGAGLLDDLAGRALLPLATLRYPVPGLPADLVLTAVTPVADGLEVTLTGRDLSLGELG